MIKYNCITGVCQYKAATTWDMIYEQLQRDFGTDNVTMLEERYCMRSRSFIIKGKKIALILAPNFDGSCYEDFKRLKENNEDIFLIENCYPSIYGRLYNTTKQELLKDII